MSNIGARACFASVTNAFEAILKQPKARSVMLSSRILRLLLVVLASAGLMAGCGGSDDDSFDDRAEVPH
jgi:hypothetical protein